MTEIQSIIGVSTERISSEIQDGGAFLLICVEVSDDNPAIDIRKTLEAISILMSNRFPKTPGKMTWMVVASVGSNVVDSISD